MGRPALPPGTTGTATAREARRGLWRARCRWRDGRGGYHETTADGDTKARALAHLSERLEAARAAADVKGDADTVADVAERWLDSLSQAGQVRPTTLAQYRATWTGTLAPVLGSRPVAEMDRAEAQQILGSLVRRRQDGEIMRDKKGRTTPLRGTQPRAVLIMVLDYAADQGLVPLNVLAGTKRPKRPAPEPRALTTAEWEWLLDAAHLQAAKTARSTPDLVDALVVMRYTGARVGEVLGLHWGDLDLTGDPPIATIERTVLEQRGGDKPGQTGPTKGGVERRIALHPEAVEYLADRKDRARRQGRSTAAGAFVFAVGSQGLPLSPPNLRTRLRALVHKTDLAWVHPHSLRHTLATEAARALDEAAAADLLGHTDARVTRRHYIERTDGPVMDPRALFPDAEEPPEGAACA